MPASMTDGIFLARPERPADGIRARGQGPVRHRRRATTYGSALFADHVPDARPRPSRCSRRPATRTSARRTCTSSPTASPRENPHFGTVPNPSAPGGSPAARAEAPRRRSRPGSPTPRSEPIRAARSAFPAACCGIVGFKPTYGLVSLDGCFPLAPSSTTSARWHGRRRLRGDDGGARARVPPRRGGARRREGRRRMARRADPLVRARIQEAADVSRTGAPSTSRCRTASSRASWRRSPTSTASSSRRTATCTAERGRQDRGLPRGHDGAARRGGRPRELYREQALEALGDFDFLLSPTLPFVAPEVGATWTSRCAAG